MSISTETTEDTYVGNASTSTAYPITFRYFDVAHLTVYADNVDITNDVVFAGDGNAETGEFTTPLTAYASSVSVVVVMDIPFDQPTVFQETGSLPAKTIEEQGLDRLNMQVRRAWRKAKKALHLGTEGGNPSTGTANTAIGFDSSGELKERTAEEIKTWLDLEGNTIVDRPNKAWNDDGERALAVPDYLGQDGHQVDTQQDYVSTGLTAGDWTEKLYMLSGSGTPATALGANGMFYVDTASGAIYEKTTGTWAVVTSPSSQEVYFVTALPSNVTGDDGDLAVIYTAGVISGLAEKSGGTWAQIATNAVTSPKPTDNNVLSWVEHFLGGKSVTVAGSLVGDQNLYFRQPVGSGGYVKPDTTNGNATPTIGCHVMATGSTSGDCVNIEMDNDSAGGNLFYVSRLTRLSNFKLYFEFKVDTAGDFYFGLCNNSASAAAPTRFAGIKAIAGTTNFQFEATNGTPVTVDSGVAVDTGWHSFELTYDGADWGMSIDGGAASTVTRTLSTGLTVTVGCWVKTNSAAAQKAYVDTIKLYGETP